MYWGETEGLAIGGNKKGWGVKRKEEIVAVRGGYDKWQEGKRIMVEGKKS